MQSLLQLLLITARERTYGEGDEWFGKPDLREANGVLARRECVVGMRVPQLRDAADVARVKLRHLDPLLPLRNRQMVELLGPAARRIEHILAVDHQPRECAEVRDIAD